MDLFKNLDYVSLGPKLRIDNKSKKKSIFGAFLSLIISSSVIFLFVYWGIEIVSKEKPYVVTREQNIDNPEVYNIDTSNFILSYKVTNDFAELLPDFREYIKVEMLYESFVNGKSNYSVFDEVKCDSYDNYKSTPRLKSFTCPKDFKAKFGGHFSNNEAYYLSILVSKCKDDDKDKDKDKNNNNNIKCKSDKEIKEYLSKGVFIIVLHKEYIIDIKDADNPITENLTPYIVPLSSLLVKESEIVYKYHDIKTDYGFIFESFDTIKTFHKHIIKERSFDLTDKSPYIYYNKLILTNYKILSERKYLKIQELAASVGGIAKFLMIIASILIKKFNIMDINTSIMNELFDFVKVKDNKKQTNYNNASSFSKSFFINNTKINNINNESNICYSINNLDNNINKSSNFNTVKNINSQTCTPISLNNIENNKNQSSNIANLINKNNICDTNKIFDLNRVNNANFNKNVEESKHESRKNTNAVFNSNKDKISIKDTAIKHTPTLEKCNFLVSSNIANKSFVYKNNFKFNLKGTRKEANLKFNFIQQLSIILCPCKKLNNNILQKKLFQYNKCKDDVKQYLNIDNIIGKIHEIEYIKAILFNKEQMLSFKYFNKPLIDYESKTYSENRLINEIRELNNLDEKSHIKIMSDYFANMNEKSITKEDSKILSLLYSESQFYVLYSKNYLTL